MNRFSSFIYCVTISTLIFSSFEVKAEQQRSNETRIIGGKEAFSGQYPSAAAIYVTTSGGSYFCGGSLINQKWVLTAASGIIAGYRYEIVLGSTTLQGTDPNRIVVSTGSRVIHPYYDYNTLRHNIALIQLHMPIEYTDYIQPINLPDEEVSDYVEHVVIGWGQTSDAVGGLSPRLNYATVSTISNSECQLSFTNTIFENMGCVAGNYNEGTCNGDSGGPLIAIVNGKQYQTGISSFISSNGCESPDPSGYTRTFPYSVWIRSHTQIIS